MKTSKAKHTCKCKRCATEFKGRFNQKYCSNSCRSAAWFINKKDASREPNAGEGYVSITRSAPNCPLCKKGRLYTTAPFDDSPVNIRCSDIGWGCIGHWVIAPLPKHSNQL